MRIIWGSVVRCLTVSATHFDWTNKSPATLNKPLLKPHKAKIQPAAGQTLSRSGRRRSVLRKRVSVAQRFGINLAGRSKPLQKFLSVDTPYKTRPLAMVRRCNIQANEILQILLAGTCGKRHFGQERHHFKTVSQQVTAPLCMLVAVLSNFSEWNFNILDQDFLRVKLLKQ